VDRQIFFLAFVAVFAVVNPASMNSAFAGLPWDSLKVNLSLQYRVMYNASNIPGPAGTSLINTKGYDFFRQRFRIGLDVQPAKDVGGYVQFEFRNAWGVGGGHSDPRGLAPGDLSLRNVAFNRLTARGLRYGYLYASSAEKHKISVGILPVSDQFSDALFSADWDFNVGGVTLTRNLDDSDYRLGYIRLVEGLGSAAGSELGNDGHLIMGDYSFSFGTKGKAGLHVYYFRNAVETLGKMQQAWFGFTGSTLLSKASVNAFGMINAGELNDESHTGVAAKLEAKFPIKNSSLSAQVIYTSGDDEGEVKNQFVTMQSLVGTEGYWAYTHILTANGPSDVNDLALDIGNARGFLDRAGLFTAQAKLDVPAIEDKLRLQIVAGYFQASKERNGTTSMGTEIGGHLTWKVAGHLHCETGVAYAALGDFLDKGTKNLYEVFSRLQLEF
jgi:hypothetical protein